ncbi:MAG: transglycosylase SLT domain-containing protein [Porticoccaceae bacterium]|nr:transglycosylase SLT domain-containing protein [Porticoccaceae bacterium]
MFSTQPVYNLLMLLALLPAVVTISPSPANATASDNRAQLAPASAPIATDQQLKAQRALYAQSMKLVRDRDWKKLRRQRTQLVNYPLYPYLIYADLIADLSYARRHEVSNYLRRYAGSVKAQHLRARWLDYLARRAYWTAYTEYYEPQTASISRQCHFYLAQYRLDNKPLAISEGLKIWSRGKSQPKTCDKLFGILIKEKHISESLAWRRFNAALLNHNFQLARYLKRFLHSSEYLQRHELYYDIERNPKRLSQRALFSSNSVEERQVIEHGLTHLARMDPNLALKHWSRYQQSHEFSHQSQAKIASSIVKGLHKKGHTKAADSYFVDHLSLLNQTLEGELTEWRIRQSLSELDWPDARVWLSRLPDANQQKTVWRYWAIRSMESDPATTLSPELNQLTQSLARERDFYGFLASEKLGRSYSINHNPAIVEHSLLRSIAGIPAMQRARELHFHGDSLDANREWSAASKNYQQQDWVAAAVLASQWQWHNKAIASMGSAKYWDDLEIRFPLAYAEPINQAAKKAGIENYLLFALARQESAFNASATSGAGAMGLVQVMPATAKSTARKHRLPYRSKKQLHSASINLPIGSSYYGDMLERFGNNRILATAAYNAGPSRVDQWLRKTDGKLPFDVWMTLIPFKETRIYVRNVMMYSAIYSRKLGLTPPMLLQHERDMLL